MFSSDSDFVANYTKPLITDWGFTIVMTEKHSPQIQFQRSKLRQWFQLSPGSSRLAALSKFDWHQKNVMIFNNAEGFNVLACKTLILFWSILQLYWFVRGWRIWWCCLKLPLEGLVLCSLLLGSFSSHLHTWLLCILSFFSFACWQSAIKLASPYWRMVFLRLNNQEMFFSTVIMGVFLACALSFFRVLGY